MAVVMGGQETGKKTVIWTGYFQWNLQDHESYKGEKAKDVKCTLWENEEERTKEDMERLRLSIPYDKVNLHLIKRWDLMKLDKRYLEGTRRLGLTLQGGQELTKFLRTGRYAGCVHYGSHASDTAQEWKELKEGDGVIILLYSRGQQNIVGFVPNEMKEFVQKLGQVGHGKNEEEIAHVDEDAETKDVEMTETNDNEDATTDLPVMSYWTYEIPEGYRPEKYIVKTTPKADGKKALNFFKGCKWAPDGSCLMTNSDDDFIRLYNVPERLFGVTDWNGYEPEGDQSSGMDPAVVVVKEGGLIYDYCWYPLMSSYDPGSCCFLTTSINAPVHLWDAFTGKLRASYLSYDHVDQVVAAKSVAFDSTGEHIHCGFDTMIRTFNITRPGRACTEQKLKHPQFSELNQPGIVSCIATSPMTPSIMAIGSYSRTVGLYHEDGSVLAVLQGHSGGVTHLRFSMDGTKLYSGARKDSRLICWDIRQMGDYYTVFNREVESNQRIYFDITKDDRYIISGGTDGVVRIWDLHKETTEPIAFPCNLDCVNGVSVNPFLPLLATSSGQRRLPVLKMSDDEDSHDPGPNPHTQPREKDIRLWKLC